MVTFRPLKIKEVFANFSALQITRTSSDPKVTLEGFSSVETKSE